MLRYRSLDMDIVTNVGVVDKAMAVVSAVADAPCSLAELQTATGLPRATAHRLAGALEAHGMLRRGADGRFDLGPALVTLGSAASDRFPLVDTARSVLDELRTATGESVQLFVREGAHRRCVLSFESPHGLRWIVPEGSVFPLEVGSAGRVLAGETGRNGWVESIGEREAGVASVSAPVVGSSGELVAAVSVSGPIERLSRQPGRRFGAAVAAAAGELSDA